MTAPRVVRSCFCGMERTCARESPAGAPSEVVTDERQRQQTGPTMLRGDWLTKSRVVKAQIHRVLAQADQIRGHQWEVSKCWRHRRYGKSRRLVAWSKLGC